MQRTVEVEGESYTLSIITAGEGLAIQEALAPDGKNSNPSILAMHIVAASLRKTVDEVKQMPWPAYLALVGPALEINGMKTADGETQGEAQAGESPAA